MTTIQSLLSSNKRITLCGYFFIQLYGYKQHLSTTDLHLSFTLLGAMTSADRRIQGLQGAHMVKGHTPDSDGARSLVTVTVPVTDW